MPSCPSSLTSNTRRKPERFDGLVNVVLEKTGRGTGSFVSAIPAQRSSLRSSGVARGCYVLSGCPHAVERDDECCTEALSLGCVA